MTRMLLRGLCVAAVAAGALTVAAPAHAAPSCIAQSVQSEHDLYGTDGMPACPLSGARTPNSWCGTEPWHAS